MIFKSVLKYKIFEWCLDTLFDKINKNFSKNPQIRRHLPKIGEYFSRIEDVDDFSKYFECIITEYVIYDGSLEIPVDTIPDGVSEDDIGIGFSFNYDLCDGEELEDIADVPTGDLSGEVCGPLNDFIFIQ